MAYSASDGILYVPVVDVFTDFTPTALDFSTFNPANGKGELVALDVNTGNVLWNASLATINVGSATVVNDVVFTATYDGTIYGFTSRTGQQVFSYKAPAGINGWPAVAGDTVVWPAGVGVNASVIALRVTQTRVINVHLFGTASGGWGLRRRDCVSRASGYRYPNQGAWERN